MKPHLECHVEVAIAPNSYRAYFRECYRDVTRSPLSSVAV